VEREEVRQLLEERLSDQRRHRRVRLRRPAEGVAEQLRRRRHRVRSRCPLLLLLPQLLLPLLLLRRWVFRHLLLLLLLFLLLVVVVGGGRGLELGGGGDVALDVGEEDERLAVLRSGEQGGGRAEDGNRSRGGRGGA
jgi:hypothetical protein